MFKRVRWVSIGAAVGFGGSVWAQRRVRRTVERYLPDQVVAAAGERARNLGSDVRDAISEGRLAMQAREAELRGQVDGRDPQAGGRPPALRAGPTSERVIDVDERRAEPHAGRSRRTRHRRR